MSLDLMVAFHAASGAAAGAATRSRFVGVVAGPFLHVLADRIPHQHPRHGAWEYASGLLIMGLLVRRRGVLDPATIGAASAVMPDLEHLIPRSISRNRKLLHPRRNRRARQNPGVTVGTQLLLTTVLMLPVLRRRKPSAQPSA